MPFVFWHYILVDEVSRITLKNYYKVKSQLLTKCDGIITNCDKLVYYKVRHSLLQIATGITKCDEFITNCDKYYKVR